MRFVAARVKGGHVELDEKVELPEGAEVLVAIPEELDAEVELDPEEAAELDAAIAASETARTYTLEEVLADWRRTHAGEGNGDGSSRSDR